jgi:hypothetical protein
MQQPTPRPWTVSTEHTMYEATVLGPKEHGARAILFQGDKATAEFIVKAVEAYDRLNAPLNECVAALQVLVLSRGTRFYLENYDPKALAQAERAINNAMCLNEEGK